MPRPFSASNASVLSPFVDSDNLYLGPSEPLSQAVYANLPLIPGGLPLTKADRFNDIDLWGLSSNVDLNTAIGAVKAIVGYRRSDIDYKHYAGGFPLNDSNEFSNQISLELRYSTPEVNRLRAVLGGYYFQEMGGFVLNFQTTPAPASVVNIQRSTTRSLAVFGQATFE